MPLPTTSTVIAVFANSYDAQAAARELTKNAFAGDHIHVTCDTEQDNSGVCTQFNDAGHLLGGVREWLDAMFRDPTEFAWQGYETFVREGKILMGVVTPEQMMTAVEDILSRHWPVDVHRSSAPKEFRIERF